MSLRDGTPREETDEKESVRLRLENKSCESELLTNIRWLTVRVLDNLDEGSRNRTLDEQQKRLLSSTGTRLLRLWRLVEKEDESKRVEKALGNVGGSTSESERPEKV